MRGIRAMQRVCRLIMRGIYGPSAFCRCYVIWPFRSEACFHCMNAVTIGLSLSRTPHLHQWEINVAPAVPLAPNHYPTKKPDSQLTSLPMQSKENSPDLPSLYTFCNDPVNLSPFDMLCKGGICEGVLRMIKVRHARQGLSEVLVLPTGS